ncbi:MAG: GNAT family N-acetyltransferase [Candidatus Thorarchaeota archaeon]
MTQWESVSKDNREIVVRHAVSGDAENLHAGFKLVIDEGRWLPSLAANASVADWVSWINRTKRTREILLIANVDGDYAGHLTLQPEEWMASDHVAKLGVIVIAKYRNVGVGRALMECAEKTALEQDYEKIILSTFHDNDVASALYDSLKYQKVGLRTRHFKMPSGYIDEILMEKHLVQ